MLRKGVYRYKYMDSWKRSDETSLPEKEDFYSNLNIEGNTDVYYKHAKTIWKDFIIKNVSEYHNLYLQSDTLLFADVFESFRNK